MHSVTTIDRDTIDQYLDGKQLLRETLIERKQLLQKLEQMAKAPQWSAGSESIAGFPIARAQALLYELYVIGEYIDTLIVEINSYADRSGKPRVNVMDTVSL